MEYDHRVYVAGHRGLVGSAIVRALQRQGYTNLLLRTRAELDLTNQAAVDNFFGTARPEYVFMAAAKVGGILANNNYPADFIRDNLAIALNVIDSARKHSVLKLLFLSSSCVYPKFAPQPMREEHILTGALEATNEPYAVAKIAGMKLCEAYNRQFGVKCFSVLPTNLYGPNDNFDLATSHVLPALIRKFHEAKITGQSVVTLWGSGEPRREFLHADDAADACIHLMRVYGDVGPVNVGVGHDLTISELAAIVARIIGFEGKIAYDRAQPDGTPRKLLDVTRLEATGWRPRISLEDGVRATYEWFVAQSSAQGNGLSANLIRCS